MVLIPSINDAGEDKDNDGIDNITEYHNGTSPIVMRGDINRDGSITIEDILLALKVASGESPEGVEKDADIDGDTLIGLAEALYGLEKVSQ